MFLFLALLSPTPGSLESAADYSEAHQGKSVIVMRDGEIVFERYSHGGGPDVKQMLASGSKSLVGVVAAAAVEDGLIQLDDRACDNLAEWKADPVKSKITYRQLLTLSSGLLPGERDAAASAPSWKDIAGKRTVGQPGGRFDYGAYHLNAFACALENRLKSETFAAYLNRRVLTPIGAKIEWRFRCADGHPQVGGGGFMTARDWAKFGELVRLRGKCGGKQVVAESALAECFKPSAANPAYGLTWWLRNPVDAPLVRQSLILRGEWADAANADWLPRDLVAACGAGKQRLYVIPSLKLVIVRQGGLGRGFEDVAFLGKLLGHAP